MKIKKHLIVGISAVILTVLAVEGAGVWLSRVDAPITYDEEAAYVVTLEASNVTEDSADLEGELVYLRGYQEVDVYFEYREKNETEPDEWNKTDDDIYSSSGRFNETIDQLSENTTYEYRAIVEKDTERLDEGFVIEFITLEPSEEISDWYELSAIRNDMEADYKLTMDLDKNSDGYEDLIESDDGWDPIGYENIRFSGTFDGDNHTISDLYINRPDDNDQGLFGHVGANEDETVIKNLCIDNATIVGGRGVGTLIGRVTGNDNTLIEGCCAVNSSVKGTGAVGGLIGSFNSWRETPGGVDNPVLSQSFADVDVTDQEDASDPDKFGGLVGCSQKGTVMDSYALGNVTVENAGERIGGLAGCIDYRGELVNSYSTGNVTADESVLVGGLVGNREGPGANIGVVTASYWNNETSTQTTSAGGEGRNTTDMTDYPDYGNAYNDWNFDTIWLDGDENDDLTTDREGNYGYPALQWEQDR